MPKINGRQTNLSMIIEGMQAFYRLREATDIKLKEFNQKIIKYHSIYHDQPDLLHAQVDRHSVSTQNKMFANIINIKKKISFVLNFIRMIPNFIKQHQKIKSAKKNQGIRSSALVALASNRIQPSNKEVDYREYIASLLVDFSPQDSVLNVDETIRRAPYLYISDALMRSPLWKMKDSCWQSGVFILDSQYLLFESLVALMSGGLRDLIQAVKKRHMLGRLWHSLILLLLAKGCHSSLRGQKNLQAFFLTSNSFSTEVLRLYLLQSQCCESVCEIMHGVPSVFYAQYIADIISVGERYGYESAKKHSSVSQIPMLPMFGALIDDVKCGLEQAINPYLNKYALDNGFQKIKITDFIARKCDEVFSKSKPNQQSVIITFIGAMSLDANYLQSKVYKIECLIMENILNELKKVNFPFVLIYAPHPGHNYDAFKHCNFINKHDIYLCRDTVFTWFISDISFALYSGALFEASFFGSSSFIVTDKDDGIFPEELLSTLNYPKECHGGDFIGAINEFIKHWDGEPAVDLIKKAEKRINLFYKNKNNNFGEWSYVKSNI